MNEYDFTLILDKDTDLNDDLVEALYEAGCDDASPHVSYGVPRIYFHREASSLEEAIALAIKNVQSTGSQVVGVEIDSFELPSILRGAERAAKLAAERAAS